MPNDNALTTISNGEGDPITQMLMRAATDPNFDPQKFEVAVRFLTDREEKANLRAFNRAMGRVAANLTAVDKDGKAPRYRYTTLDAMLKVIRPVCAPEGIQFRFGTQPPTIPGNQCVTCVLSHDDGHESIIALEAPTQETTGIRGGAIQMNDIQAIGSTLTYLKRYALGMAFTLILADEQDDDGVAAGKPRPVVSTPSRDVKPDTARAASKYPKVFATLQTIPTLERLDDYKSHPKFTAWWDGEAKIARANGKMIDDMLYARRLELEAIAESERVVAEARTKAETQQRMVDNFDRGEAQRKEEQAEQQGEPASSDLDLDEAEQSDTTVKVDAVPALLGMIAASETRADLGALVQNRDFAVPLGLLATPDRNRVETAFNARHAALPQP